MTIASKRRIITRHVKCSAATIRLPGATKVSFYLALHFQAVSICCQISLVLHLLPRARPEPWRRSLALAIDITSNVVKKHRDTLKNIIKCTVSANDKSIFRWHLPISSSRAAGFWYIRSLPLSSAKALRRLLLPLICAPQKAGTRRNKRSDH